MKSRPLTRMAKRIDSSKCWQGCGAPGTLIPCKLTCPLTSRGVWPKGGTGRTLKGGWRMLWSLPAALRWGLSGGPLAAAPVLNKTPFLSLVPQGHSRIWTESFPFVPGAWEPYHPCIPNPAHTSVNGTFTTKSV